MRLKNFVLAQITPSLLYLSPSIYKKSYPWPAWWGLLVSR